MWHDFFSTCLLCIWCMFTHIHNMYTYTHIRTYVVKAGGTKNIFGATYHKYIEWFYHWMNSVEWKKTFKQKLIENKIPDLFPHFQPQATLQTTWKTTKRIVGKIEVLWDALPTSHSYEPLWDLSWLTGSISSFAHVPKNIVFPLNNLDQFSLPYHLPVFAIVSEHPCHHCHHPQATLSFPRPNAVGAPRGNATPRAVRGSLDKFSQTHQVQSLPVVGGFNPFEKYESNWIIPPGWGEKNIWNHHHLDLLPRYLGIASPQQHFFVTSMQHWCNSAPMLRRANITSSIKGDKVLQGKIWVELLVGSFGGVSWDHIFEQARALIPYQHTLPIPLDLTGTHWKSQLPFLMTNNDGKQVIERNTLTKKTSISNDFISFTQDLNSSTATTQPQKRPFVL